MAHRDVDDEIPLSMGATDTEVSETAPDDDGFAWVTRRRRATSTPRMSQKSTATSTRTWRPYGPSGEFDEVVTALEALDTAALRGVQRLCCGPATRAPRRERTPVPTPPTTP